MIAFIKKHIWFLLFVSFYAVVFIPCTLWGWDEAMYYSQLSSPWCDSDLRLHDDLLMTWNDPASKYTLLTSNVKDGALWVAYPFGKALIEGLYLGPSLLLEHLLGLPRFSRLFLAASHLGIICQALLMFLFLRKMLRLLKFRLNDIGIAIVLIFVGTPLFFYSTENLYMTHLLSALTSSLTAYYSLRWVREQRLGFAVGAGCSLALAALTRWQDIIIGLFPLLLFLGSLTSGRRKNPGKLFLQAFALAAATVGVFSIQNVVWHKIFGAYLTVPQGESFFAFKHPFIREIIFSGFHGILPWSPVYGVCFLGLVLLLMRNGFRLVSLASMAVILAHVYVCASTYSWHGAASFGSRRMTTLTPFAILGLVEMIRIIPRPDLKYFVLAVCAWAYFCNAIYGAGLDDFSLVFRGRPSPSNPFKDVERIQAMGRNARPIVVQSTLRPYKLFQPGLVLGNALDRTSPLRGWVLVPVLTALWIAARRTFLAAHRRKRLRRILILAGIVYFVGTYLFLAAVVPNNRKTDEQWDKFLKDPLATNISELPDVPFPAPEFIKAIALYKVGRDDEAKETLSVINTTRYRNLTPYKVQNFAITLR